MNKETELSAKLGKLPHWDLSDLYDGPDSDALKKDLDDARSAARALSEKHAGKVASLDGAALGELVG